MNKIYLASIYCLGVGFMNKIYLASIYCLGVGFYLQEDVWKLSSDKREVFFLFIAIHCLISTQTY